MTYVASVGFDEQYLPGVERTHGLGQSVIKLNETTVVSASWDRTVRVWDLTNGTSQVLERTHDGVWSVIKLNETTVVSASFDHTLRVWDLTNDTSQGVERTHGILSIR